MSTNSVVIGATGFEPETSYPCTKYTIETRNCQDRSIDYVKQKERAEKWRRVKYNSARVVPPYIVIRLLKGRSSLEENVKNP